MKYLRVCPGQKEFVTVRTIVDGHVQREHKQKRLLLANLHEIYVDFKKKTNYKIGFSTFCELRPKWCVTVGVTGTYVVWVCLTHQNVKLMLAALNPKLHYKDLLSKLVCAVDAKDCMLHRCTNCPGQSALYEFLNA